MSQWLYENLPVRVSYYMWDLGPQFFRKIPRSYKIPPRKCSFSEGMEKIGALEKVTSLEISYPDLPSVQNFVPFGTNFTHLEDPGIILAIHLSNFRLAYLPTLYWKLNSSSTPKKKNPFF